MVKRNHTTNPPQSVAEAEQVLAGFEAKRGELLAVGEKLAARRRDRSFKSLARDGDAVLKRDLQQAIAVSMANDALVASLDEAIAEAKNRITIARLHEVAAADRARAAQIREMLDGFRRTGHELSDALNTVAETGARLGNLLTQLHGLGVVYPTGQQLDILGHQAVVSAISATPWSRHYPLLPPDQRRTFRPLVDGWCAMVESRVRAQLGDEQKGEAA
jgi:hypothetical protein